MPSKQHQPNEEPLSGHQVARSEGEAHPLLNQLAQAGLFQEPQASTPQLLRPHDILQLQRTIGNRAVSALLTGGRSSSPQSAAAGPTPTRGQVALQSPVATDISRPMTDEGTLTIQRKRANAQVTGITHLVQLAGRSLFRGREGAEVTESTVLEVETEDRLRSRRGPNQEMFQAYDQPSRRLYRWYRVVTIDGVDVEGGSWYVREDAFTLPEQDMPRVSTDLALQDRHRRTRQSHKLVRLEAWYNTDRSIDLTGHMIMYDYQRDTYREYAITPPRSVSPAIPLSVGESTGTFQEGAPSVSYTDVRDQSTKTSQPKSLTASERSPASQLGYMRAQTRKEGKVRRFNEVLTCDLLVTEGEYQHLLNMFVLRLAVGHYNFVYEARTVRNPFATRCLSMVEDIARLRRLVLQQGYADDVLRDFIAQATIDASHVTRGPSHQ